MDQARRRPTREEGGRRAEAPPRERATTEPSPVEVRLRDSARAIERTRARLAETAARIEQTRARLGAADGRPGGPGT